MCAIKAQKKKMTVTSGYDIDNNHRRGSEISHSFGLFAC